MPILVLRNQDMKLISFLTSLTLIAITFSNTLEVSLATVPFLTYHLLILCLRYLQLFLISLFLTSKVFKSLVSLDPTKAMGIDCIGPRILKECAHILFNLFIISYASAFLLIPFLRNGDSTELPPYINLVIVLWCLTTDPFPFSVPSPRF